jgi:hypothetical protein
MVKVLTLIFILQLFTSISITYSQEDIPQPDSIIAGRSYTFMLYDETEIIGRVLSIGRENIQVKTESGHVYNINRSNLLYFSTETTPSKYYASVSLLGGVSLLTNRDSYYYNDNINSGLNLDLAGFVYFSDSKALKVDLGYSYIKADYNNNYTEPAIYPYYPSTYTGGNISYYSLKGNFLFGTFKPKNKIIAYGSVGFGFHVTSQSEINEEYYNYNDSSYRTNNIHAKSVLNAVLSAGGGFAYMVSKQVGIHAEIEYNFLTSEGDLYMFRGYSYFPIRAGIIYTIF